MSLIASALFVLAGSSPVVPAVLTEEPDPKAMSYAEIRAFNAPLDKNHKFYIRCKRSAATGSLIQREMSCRTNEKWALADVRGNQEARDIGEEMQSKSWNISN